MSTATAEPRHIAPAHQPIYDARDLVTSGGTATIVLDGQTYVLRITRGGKLILTK